MSVVKLKVLTTVLDASVTVVKLELSGVEVLLISDTAVLDTSVFCTIEETLVFSSTVEVLITLLKEVGDRVVAEDVVYWFETVE